MSVLILNNVYGTSVLCCVVVHWWRDHNIRITAARGEFVVARKQWGRGDDVIIDVVFCGFLALPSRHVVHHTRHSDQEQKEYKHDVEHY